MTVDTLKNQAETLCARVHPGCIVCSARNACGLNLQFEVQEDTSIKAVFECNAIFSGYAGILHGGVITSLMDGAMGHCLFARGLAAVTVEMTTRFRHPIIIGTEATVTARVVRNAHPLYLLEAEITQNTATKATAKAKFYHQPKLAGP